MTTNSNGKPTEQQRLQAILANLQAAREHLDRIRRCIERVAQEGMYEARPTESWQDRGGDAKYLYHYFPYGSNGRYLGPGGKKKIYIGADPARIAEARRLATNRQLYDLLQAAYRKLSDWIRYRESELANLAANTSQYPTFDFTTLPQEENANAGQ